MQNFSNKFLFTLLQFAILQLFCFSIYAAETGIEMRQSNDVTMNVSTMSVDNNPKIMMKLKYGNVEIELYPDKAPKHVERVLSLINKGFYNGLKFHRVIDGFMVQTGDPKGDGTGSSDEPNLVAEFNDIKHERGIISMARSNDPNSANSQFFIMLAEANHLDGQYTAFGKVIKGMEFIDMIKKGDQNQNGKVEEPDIIEDISVVDNTAANINHG